MPTKTKSTKPVAKTAATTKAVAKKKAPVKKPEEATHDYARGWKDGIAWYKQEQAKKK